MMTLGMIFWIFFLVALIVGVWQGRSSWPASVPWLVVWILLGILGWAVFGGPIK